MADRRRRRKPVNGEDSDDSSDESVNGVINHTLSDLVSCFILVYVSEVGISSGLPTTAPECVYTILICMHTLFLQNCSKYPSFYFYT